MAFYCVCVCVCVCAGGGTHTHIHTHTHTHTHTHVSLFSFPPQKLRALNKPAVWLPWRQRRWCCRKVQHWGSALAHLLRCPGRRRRRRWYTNWRLGAPCVGTSQTLLAWHAAHANVPALSLLLLLAPKSTREAKKCQGYVGRRETLSAGKKKSACCSLPRFFFFCRLRSVVEGVWGCFVTHCDETRCNSWALSVLISRQDLQAVL